MQRFTFLQLKNADKKQNRCFRTIWVEMKMRLFLPNLESKEEIIDHGNIQTDGYNVYDSFEGMDGITLYGCWVHARRKFVEALDEDDIKATQAIVYIKKL